MKKFFLLVVILQIVFSTLNAQVRKDVKIEELKKKAKDNRLILLNVAPKTGKIDVVGSKLLKSFEFLNAKLKSNDFKMDW